MRHQRSCVEDRRAQPDAFCMGAHHDTLVLYTWGRRPASDARTGVIAEVLPLVSLKLQRSGWLKTSCWVIKTGEGRILGRRRASN